MLNACASEQIMRLISNLLSMLLSFTKFCDNFNFSIYLLPWSNHGCKREVAYPLTGLFLASDIVYCVFLVDAGGSSL